jgi:hypothetical protein
MHRKIKSLTELSKPDSAGTNDENGRVVKRPSQHYGYSSRPKDIQDRVAYAVQATDESLEKLFSCSTLKADGSNYDEWVAEVKPLLGAAKCLEFNTTGPTAAN